MLAGTPKFRLSCTCCKPTSLTLCWFSWCVMCGVCSSHLPAGKEEPAGVRLRGENKCSLGLELACPTSSHKFPQVPPQTSNVCPDS